VIIAIAISKNEKQEQVTGHCHKQFQFASLAMIKEMN
jgi:hypothetical protein